MNALEHSKVRLPFFLYTLYINIDIDDIYHLNSYQKVSIHANKFALREQGGDCPSYPLQREQGGRFRFLTGIFSDFLLFIQ